MKSDKQGEAGQSSAQRKPWFARYIPTRDQIFHHRALKRLQPWLDHPYLWHPSRHTIPGAVAAGLVAAMIPGPFQMLAATLFSIKYRLHLPTAIAATLVSNPLTIIPIYWLAHAIGAMVLDYPLLNLTQLQNSARLDVGWLWSALGWPWLLGMILLTGAGALIAYIAVKWIWDGTIRYRWRMRHQSR